MAVSASDAIEVEALTKKFGSFTAVDGVTFSVRKGELFGLLGPNGAGKTTTIKMLTTLLGKTSGRARVGHYDIETQKNQVRKKIGIVFQDPSLDDKLTGRENLAFHAALYNMGRSETQSKIDEVLDLVELTDKQDVLIENYSGGMKRRLEIGRGLLHNPDVLFLDEPTLGLDVQTRRKIWDYIKRLNQVNGITMVLTTHYIEEADELCQRVAFIDHGKIVALDKPEALKRSMGGDVVSLDIGESGAKLKQALRGIKWINSITLHGEMADLNLKNGEEHIPQIIKHADKHGVKIRSVHFHKPTLEDVFIKYTGKTIREEEGDGKQFMRAFARRGMR